MAENCTIWRSCLLAMVLILACMAPSARAQKWQLALRQFDHQKDLPSQRAALLQLFDTVGRNSMLTATLQSQVVGSPGLYAWNTPNTSYCAWWGINCCGTTLTASLQLCSNGEYSVSGLLIMAVNLTGQLPDIFGQLPDLQVLHIAFNRGGCS